MNRIVIIGGGAIGLSLAYHLGKRRMDLDEIAATGVEIVLLERNTLTSGTSWHAAGIVGPLRSTPNMTQLASHALELFPRLEKETGLATGYRCTGGYWLAREADRLDELRRIADLGVTQGLTPQLVSPDLIDVPLLDCSGLLGALQVPEDATVNPVDLCMAYARGAKSIGVNIRENCSVTRILTEHGCTTGVALGDGSELPADKVVICTGAWSRELAQTAGLFLPLQAVEHMYVVTEPISDLPDPFPVIRDLDRGIYIKGDAGKLVIGGFEPDAKCWNPYGVEGDRAFLEMPEDWEQFTPFMQAALALMPSLDEVGIQHFMNGPESFSFDTKPLVGEAPHTDNLFVAAGMNSVGVMSSAGIGRALADWIVDGEQPVDLWEVDIARADPRTAEPEHMAERMKEAVADLFSMHWPYKQPKAGRGLRTSPLHEHWQAQGAHFGLTAGWERGLWYAQSGEDSGLAYSTGAQNWWPIARREAAAMSSGASLLDLTPFSKINIFGTHAVDELNRLTTAQMDVAIGRAVYCQMLNAKGGIELDITITRLAADHFHLTSGAATRQRDLAYLRRHLNGCEIEDVTDDFCTIGVMGAAAPQILSQLRSQTVWHGVPPGMVLQAKIDGREVRATRMSFVGEYGWELTVANDQAGAIFDQLISAGAKPMGHYALDGCRLEKGFKHWGHDIGPTTTPLEAGLGFTVDWSKDFVGKKALLEQKSKGLTTRLFLFHVDGAPLLLHDEPICQDGVQVGLTTSGGRGPRTGLDLAFGLIDVEPKETRELIAKRHFSIRVAGKNYKAKILPRAPFDPLGERMKP